MCRILIFIHGLPPKFVLLLSSCFWWARGDTCVTVPVEVRGQHLPLPEIWRFNSCLKVCMVSTLPGGPLHSHLKYLTFWYLMIENEASLSKKTHTHTPPQSCFIARMPLTSLLSIPLPLPHSMGITSIWNKASHYSPSCADVIKTLLTPLGSLFPPM